MVTLEQDVQEDQTISCHLEKDCMKEARYKEGCEVVGGRIQERMF